MVFFQKVLTKSRPFFTIYSLHPQPPHRTGTYKTSSFISPLLILFTQHGSAHTPIIYDGPISCTHALSLTPNSILTPEKEIKNRKKRTKHAKNGNYSFVQEIYYNPTKKKFILIIFSGEIFENTLYICAPQCKKSACSTRLQFTRPRDSNWSRKNVCEGGCGRYLLIRRDTSEQNLRLYPGYDFQFFSFTYTPDFSRSRSRRLVFYLFFIGPPKRS